MNIRAVIFDFAGVLCFHPTREQAAEVAAACGLSVPEFLQAFWANRHPYDAGKIEPQEYWHGVARATGRTFDDGLVTELVRLETGLWNRYDDGVLAWVAQLRAKGVQSYGIGPAMTEDDRTNYAWHSDVERLSESALYQFVEFTWNAVTEVAVKK